MADEIIPLEEKIDELKKRNRELSREVIRLSVLARLATVISHMEMKNDILYDQQFKLLDELEEMRVKWQSATLIAEVAEARVAELEGKRIVN